jgi:hypothetical protein
MWDSANWINVISIWTGGGVCERGDQNYGSIKRGAFSNYLSDFQLSKNGSAA